MKSRDTVKPEAISLNYAVYVGQSLHLEKCACHSVTKLKMTLLNSFLLVFHMSRTIFVLLAFPYWSCELKKDFLSCKRLRTETK